jgi:hypothetical protein
VSELNELAGAEAPSWFALVLAHEVGHHVQYALGAITKERRLGKQGELQADCYAGLWLRRANERALKTTGRRAYPEPTVEAFVLEALGADPDAPEIGVHPPVVNSHGTRTDRIAALRRGLAATSRKDCELIHF